MKDLRKLKEEIAVKFGKGITTPANFDALSFEISKTTGKDISVSTLKRIWGYVKYPHEPRHEILSILSQYIGYKDWNDYINSEGISDTSHFLNKELVESGKLKGGEIIQVAWAPNRVCEFRYLGDNRFEVVEARNSKIQKGDTFLCRIIAKGEPLMCSNIIRNGRIAAEGYVAARSRGLHELKIKISD